MASDGKQVVQPTGDGGGGAGKEGNVAEGGSVLQPLNPGVPIRGIRMKFAVLAGLVEVGEVSIRDIVDTIFNLVGWLPFQVQVKRTASVCRRRLMCFVFISLSLYICIFTLLAY